MIEIFGLNYSFYKNQVLDNLNVKFQKGKVNCIIGKNGSGKSTLLKCISRIYKIEKGSIKIESKKVHEISNKELARKITYLPQIKDVPRITVEKLVSFGRYPYKKYPYTMNDNDNKIINNAIKTIGISNIKDKFLENLSGGEKQKAYLAMAIAQDTDILLLDEVTVFLDIYNQLEVFNLLKKLARTGKTIVVVSHNLSFALSKADNVMILNNGKIIKDGPSSLIYDSKEFLDTFQVKVFKINNDYIIKEK